jgi:hypothetical protein
MCLQNDTHPVFHTGSSRLANYYITNFILDGFETEILAKFLKELNCFALVLRWAGNLCEGVEVFPHSLGFLDEKVSYCFVFNYLIKR